MRDLLSEPFIDLGYYLRDGNFKYLILQRKLFDENWVHAEIKSYKAGEQPHYSSKIPGKGIVLPKQCGETALGHNIRAQESRSQEF